MSERAYIAGPMTGLPNWNFDAFFDMEAKLTFEGFEVENPAKNGADKTKSWEWYLKRAIAQMLTCDTVVALDNWHQSKGAMLEIYVARKLGMDILDSKLEELQPRLLQGHQWDRTKGEEFCTENGAEAVAAYIDTLQSALHMTVNEAGSYAELYKLEKKKNEILRGKVAA